MYKPKNSERLRMFNLGFSLSDINDFIRANIDAHEANAGTYVIILEENGDDALYPAMLVFTKWTSLFFKYWEDFRNINPEIELDYLISKYNILGEYTVEYYFDGKECWVKHPHEGKDLMPLLTYIDYWEKHDSKKKDVESQEILQCPEILHIPTEEELTRLKGKNDAWESYGRESNLLEFAIYIADSEMEETREFLIETINTLFPGKYSLERNKD